MAASRIFTISLSLNKPWLKDSNFVPEGPSTLSAKSNLSFLGDVGVSCCKRLFAGEKREILLVNSIDMTEKETTYLFTLGSNLVVME